MQQVIPELQAVVALHPGDVVFHCEVLEYVRARRAHRKREAARQISARDVGNTQQLRGVSVLVGSGYVRDEAVVARAEVVDERGAQDLGRSQSSGVVVVMLYNLAAIEDRVRKLRIRAALVNRFIEPVAEYFETRAELVVDTRRIVFREILLQVSSLEVIRGARIAVSARRVRQCPGIKTQEFRRDWVNTRRGDDIAGNRRTRPLPVHHRGAERV